MVVNISLRRAFSRLILAVTLVCGPTLAYGSELHADENLLGNDNLTDGTDVPNGWQIISRLPRNPPQAAQTFVWTHSPPAPGELQLNNRTFNSVKWDHPIELERGWYSLTGEMRASGIEPIYGAAILGVEVTSSKFGLAFPDTRPESDWRKGTLYLKVGSAAKQIDVVCALDGRGTVACRNISLVRISGPPTTGGRVIDVDTVRRAELKPIFRKAKGHMWTLFSTLLLLAAIAISGWIALGPSDSQ